MGGPVPRRVEAAAKEALLVIIDQASDAGRSLRRICSLLEIDEARVWRWQAPREEDRLKDHPPGGGAVHGLLEWEVAEIIALAE